MYRWVTTVEVDSVLEVSDCFDAAEAKETTSAGRLPWLYGPSAHLPRPRCVHWRHVFIHFFDGVSVSTPRSRHFETVFLPVHGSNRWEHSDSRNWNVITPVAFLNAMDSRDSLSLDEHRTSESPISVRKEVFE
jgi:hypothetical protein